MASTLKPVSLRISSDDDEPRDGSHLGSRSKIPSGMMSPGMAIFNRVMTPTNSSASLPSPRSTPRSPRTPKMIIEVLRSKKASAKKPSVEHLQIPTGKKKAAKQQQNSIVATGHVRFIHKSRLWGKVTLSTANKWGENDVWFHVDTCHARRMPMLGDNVNVEYIYSRARGLRALSVTPRTKSKFSNTSTASHWRSGTSQTSGSNHGVYASFKKNSGGNHGDFASFKTRKWRTGGRQSPDKRSPEKQSPEWVTPDKRRQTKLTKNKPKPTKAKTARTVSATVPKNSPNIRVAKGPAPNGQHGFRFKRSV